MYLTFQYFQYFSQVRKEESQDAKEKYLAQLMYETL